MNFKVLNSKLKSGSKYRGEVTRYIYNENSGRIKIYVSFFDEEDSEYYKSFDVELSQHSYFVRFCDNFNLIDENGEINMDEIIGYYVIGKLQKGKNGGMYISYIEPDWKLCDEINDALVGD